MSLLSVNLEQTANLEETSLEKTYRNVSNSLLIYYIGGFNYQVDTKKINEICLVQFLDSKG
jgi:hypothetical protein